VHEIEQISHVFLGLRKYMFFDETLSIHTAIQKLCVAKTFLMLFLTSHLWNRCPGEDCGDLLSQEWEEHNVEADLQPVWAPFCLPLRTCGVDHVLQKEWIHGEFTCTKFKGLFFYVVRHSAKANSCKMSVQIKHSIAWQDDKFWRCLATTNESNEAKQFMPPDV